MAITTTSSLSDLVQTAYDKAVEFAFQPNLRFAQLADDKRWDIATAPVPGDVVTFTIFTALTTATGAIPETTDPGPQSLGDSQKSVTLVEHGKLITTTQKLRMVSFANIDLAVGKIVGDNMGKSVDEIARIAFDASTAAAYIQYAGSNVYPTGVTASDVITAAIARYAYNRLDRNNVPKIDGNFYNAVLHSDVLYDLKAETGAGAWRVPKQYVDPEEIYSGEVGEFEGFRFISTSQAKLLTDGGSLTVDLYSSYFCGFQAIGHAIGQDPAMGTSGPFDAMQRLMNVFWYGLMGYQELRPESLYKVFSASSIGANT